MLFKRRTIEDYTDSLAAYMPGGPLFIAKNIKNSNFRKLLKGMAGELFRANGLLREFDTLPDQTYSFIEEWESALGIPDECFTEIGTIEERRRNILVKLASLGIQTVDDFEAFALVFGKEITVRQANDGEFTGYDSPKHRFVIVVEGENLVSGFPPYDLPMSFESNEDLLQCILNRVKPAHCIIIFRNI